MTDKSALEKMRLKPGASALLLHVPEELKSRLELVESVSVASTPAAADFIVDFAESQRQAEKRLLELQPYVRSQTLVWLAYPRGSKAAGCDTSRDTYGSSRRASASHWWPTSRSTRSGPLCGFARASRPSRRRQRAYGAARAIERAYCLIGSKPRPFV